MGSSGGANAINWTETMEDLLLAGEIDEAVCFLESTVFTLNEELEKEQLLPNENGGKSRDQLCTALQDLSKLYDDRGFSLSADQARARASELRRIDRGFDVGDESIFVEAYEEWETIPEELLYPLCLPGISTLSLEDSESSQGSKRQGTFPYKKEKGLYSDDLSYEPLIDESADTTAVEDVEKTKSLEASHSIRRPFNFRVPDEDNIVLRSIPPEDMELPRPRPPTSGSGAQSEHGLGI